MIPSFDAADHTLKFVLSAVLLCISARKHLSISHFRVLKRSTFARVVLVGTRVVS